MTDELRQIMAQAAGIAAGSTLRYGRALAGVAARHQSALAQAVTGQQEAEATALPRPLVDDLRAYFREIGEAACQEARRLALELESINEQLARATDAGVAPEAHRRPHKAKE